MTRDAARGAGVRRGRSASTPLAPRVDSAAKAFFRSKARRRGAVNSSLPAELLARLLDRKSTRLNSSHLVISYAVFCLKKKKGRLAVGATATATVGVASTVT